MVTHQRRISYVCERYLHRERRPCFADGRVGERRVSANGTYTENGVRAVISCSVTRSVASAV